MSESILAADVGGTHARFGIVEVTDVAGGESARLSVVRTSVFECNQYAGLAEICKRFLAECAEPAPRRGAIAIAGLRVGDRIAAINLPWAVHPDHIRQAIGFDELPFINDFVAAALGVCELSASDVATLRGPVARLDSTPPEPILVIGPGTGLGAAALLPDQDGWLPVASEAGQTTFAPSTQLEFELLQSLRGENDLLTVGELLSGPGLARLDAFLRRDLSGRPRSPAEITTAALQDGEATARRSLEMFCELLGKVAGDLALVYKARGGVYLVGGILPRIRALLLGSDFLERFEAKGVMRGFLHEIPVYLVDHPHLGILGAARWWARQRKRSGSQTQPHDYDRRSAT